MNSNVVDAFLVRVCSPPDYDRMQTGDNHILGRSRCCLRHVALLIEVSRGAEG